MKCRVCVDRSCAACRKTHVDTPGPLRDGAYANATVVVRGGKIAAIRPGTAVFHSFNDNCLPDGTGGDTTGAITPATVTPILLQSSDCISITGRGNTAAPYIFNPRLNTRDFICSPDGITLKQPYTAPATVLPAYITSVHSNNPDVVSIDVSTTGVLSVGVTAAGLGIGKTRYSTFIKGTCGGSYPVWVNYIDGQYILNIGAQYEPGATIGAGVIEPTGAIVVQKPTASMVFPDLATAITAADAVPLINNCAAQTAGGN